MSRFRVLAVLALLLTACSVPTATPSLQRDTPTATPIPSPTATAAPSMTPAPTTLPTPTATATVTPSPTATLAPSPTPTRVPPTATPIPTPSPTPLPDDLWIGPSDVRVHPDGDAYYSGDLISFQVYAHHGHEWASSGPPDVDVEIWLGEPDEGELIAEDRIAFYGQQDGAAWLEWVWDTAGLVGPQTLSVVLDPDDRIQVGDEDLGNNLVARTVELRPPDELPVVWADAHWVQRESACCTFHFVSGTAAERDIETVMAIADEAVAYAGDQLGEDIERVALDVYLIDRVLGHGGFAGDAVTISYLDRFYAGGDLTLVFRHEATHVLDRRFAEVRPTLLAEGLAVYVSGGHFREEPIPERMAALLALDRYIPLSELAEDFYPMQHEIGYLEAAGFVKYLVDRFGWDEFKVFYGDIQHNDAGAAAMIDAALQEHFGLTLRQAESDWLTMLQRLPAPAAQITDLRLTIEFYDTLRRYQQDWDPAAYFLKAWLAPFEEAERRQVTADAIRHPTRPVNVALETMFVAADRAMDKGDYDQVEALLGAIKTVLDAGGDLAADPLANQYRSLVGAAAAAGYEAQQIDLDLQQGIAHVLATEEHGAERVGLTFARSAGSWRVMSWGH